MANKDTIGFGEVSELKKFLAELDEEVTAKCAGEGEDGETIPADIGLAQVIFELLEEEGVTTEAELCPFADKTGRRRCAITGYSFDEAEGRLDLFLARHVANGMDVTNLPASELSQLAGKAARFFDYACKGDWDRFAGLPEVLDAARKIRGQLKELTSARVFILTNAVVRDREIEGLEVAGIPLNFEVVDAERLFRLSMSTTSRQDIDIDFKSMLGRPLACLEMKPRAPEYETYLAIFTGQMLYELYERYGQRLFEFNVRAFLQAKGKVNKGIRDSLRDHPDRFMAYNNGIVATADELEVGLFHGEQVISKIIGLQIVNGAQTTASIYRAKKTEKIDLSKVSVAVKITRVASEKLKEFVPLISRFANTQNVIQIADLSANNEFHIELERLSQQEWCPGEESRWFYERARGAYQDALQREGSTAAKRREFKRLTPSSQRFTKTDLAKYLMTWMGRPHTVSMGAQKNFSIFMSELPELFPAGWKPDEAFYKRCVAHAILYRACEHIVRARKFAAYRANIAVYTYALLAHVSNGEVDLDYVWKHQEISDPLKVILDDWVQRVDAEIRASAGARNVTEWCKKSECWDAVRSLPVSISGKIPPELSDKREQRSTQAETEATEVEEQTVPDGHSLDDEEAIEECMRHDASTWAKLNFWGVSSKTLDYYERGVAHTLSEYANLGWAKRPSAKQARIGLRVLSRGREAQLI